MENDIGEQVMESLTSHSHTTNRQMESLKHFEEVDDKIINRIPHCFFSRDGMLDNYKNFVTRLNFLNYFYKHVPPCSAHDTTNNGFGSSTCFTKTI